MVEQGERFHIRFIEQAPDLYGVPCGIAVSFAAQRALPGRQQNKHSNVLHKISGHTGSLRGRSNGKTNQVRQEIDAGRRARGSVY
jgi:hypothetical protein